MGNLGDALKKAGLISEADQRRAQSTRGERRRGERSPRTARSRGSADSRSRRESGTAIEAQAVDMRGAGERWHYQDAEGRLPFVLVTRDARQRLERGEYALVASGRSVLVVPAAAARRLPAEHTKRIIHIKKR